MEELNFTEHQELAATSPQAYMDGLMGKSIAKKAYQQRMGPVPEIDPRDIDWNAVEKGVAGRFGKTSKEEAEAFEAGIESARYMPIEDVEIPIKPTTMNPGESQ